MNDAGDPQTCDAEGLRSGIGVGGAETALDFDGAQAQSRGVKWSEGQFFVAGGKSNKRIPFRTSCPAGLLLLALLLTLPAVAQAQFIYTTNNGTITITEYTGPGGDVTIPDTITGLSVTSIGDGAFQYNLGLTGVTIPNSVTSIGIQAFASCSGLSQVMIPGGVTNIGESGFLWCSSLTNVTIGNAVTSIGSEAFHYCQSLTDITIPGSVANIGPGAFLGCTRLVAIIVDAQNDFYSSWDGILFDKGQATLIQCPGGKVGSVAIPTGVTSIGRYAFTSCTNLTDVTIPGSVTNIGGDAFNDCRSLTNVTMSYGVTTIGDYAFEHCNRLTSVVIPDSVASIGWAAFSACTSLTNVTMGNSVTNLGSYAFRFCTGLTSVTIPDSATTIGVLAFADCANLAAITIGHGATNIGNSAFLSCTRLKGVYFLGNAPSFVGLGVFDGDVNAIVYYLPGTTGWGPTFAGRPTALWRPQVQSSDASFGVRTNQFGFDIIWASGQVIVVEASANLDNPTWVPLQTNTLSSASFYFSDPAWANYPSRFYRLRSP